ncbi:geranylgeranyl transferase type-2 subunit beta [Physcia stellaris]|nr:geranylgeranyl transferase type-2 subunit beta [Physcia stellaris]
MLNLDSRNFHGWGYRRMITKSLESDNSDSQDRSESVAEAEFEYTTKMIRANLSNFSAWHYRSKLIPRLLDERKADDKARLKMLDQELEMIQRGLYTDPNDQSLWFYYQNLLCTFDPVYASRSMAPTMSNEQRLEYVSKELENLSEMLDGAEDYLSIASILLLESENYVTPSKLLRASNPPMDDPYPMTTSISAPPASTHFDNPPTSYHPQYLAPQQSKPTESVLSSPI